MLRGTRGTIKLNYITTIIPLAAITCGVMAVRGIFSQELDRRIANINVSWTLALLAANQKKCSNQSRR